MSDLVRMSAEDEDGARQRVKLENTRLIMDLVDSLKPYVDGSLGPVSPNHASAYLKAVRELGLLWHAYDRPAAPVEAPEGVDEGLVALEARQEAVLAELGKLRAVGMRGRPRS